MDAGMAPEWLLRYSPERYQDVPMPWTTEGFVDWLRDRAAWRARSVERPPGLRVLERCAVLRMGVPAALAAGENAS